MEDFHRRAVYVQLIDSGDFMLQSVESAFEISLELLLLLIADALKKALRACLFELLTFAKRKLLAIYLVISRTFYFVVNMFERLISSGHTLGPVQFETDVPNSKEQLVVLSSPAPEVVRHSVHFFEILNSFSVSQAYFDVCLMPIMTVPYVMRKHEDAADVVRVVIFWMQFGRSDVNRAVRRVLVFYLVSLRNQIDIVHHDVVNLIILFLFN